MKKIKEEGNEDFFEQGVQYLTFQSPNLGENQTFWNTFGLADVSFKDLKTFFRKIFL